MKKENFYIYVSRLLEDGTRVTGPVLQPGYTFIKDGEKYGMHKTGKEWTVTELHTGFSVVHVQKRADGPVALSDSIVARIRDLITGAEPGTPIWNCMEQISNAYAG